MQEYPIRLLRKIVETYSPSGSEAAIARLINEEMRTLGFAPRLDQSGNVVAEVGEQGPEILLCSHMDTVPGEIPVKLENGFLYGRGAVDAKSSLAAMVIGTSKAVIDEKVPIRAKLVCVVEEETSSKGFKAILAKTSRPQFAIFGEPSGLTNIVTGYKGRIHLEITVTTAGGHSAAPWLSKNSIEEAHTFWTKIRDSILDNHSISKFNAVTGSLTRIANSGPANSIPSHTTITVDIRTPPETDPFSILNEIQSLAQSHNHQHPEVLLLITVKDVTKPYLVDPHSRLVAACRGAVRSVAGDPAILVKKTGTSDMNLLPAGTPAIAYGPGDSRLDHTDQERIQISEYLKSVEVYCETLRKLSRVAATEIPVAA